MQLHLWPRLDRMRSRSWRRRHAAFLAYTSSIEISEVMRVIYIYIHHVCESSCSWEEMPADLDSIAKMMVTLLIQQAGSAADALRGVHTEPPGPSGTPATPAVAPATPGAMSVPATPAPMPSTPAHAPGTPSPHADISNLQLAIPENGPGDIDRCNSASHPREFAAFKRWAEANKGEIQTAWNKGGAAKMSAFKKFVMANCNPLAVEAVMRFQVYSETENKDEGEYYTFADLVRYYGGVWSEDPPPSSHRRHSI